MEILEYKERQELMVLLAERELQVIQDQLEFLD